MKNYAELRNEFTNELVCITCDGIGSIPIDPDNRDYQEYLEWLAEGNTPEPADSE